MDGSVRFIKDGVESWPQDATTQLPRGITFNPNGTYLLDASVRRGVYQALSTRNGGEVVDYSSY